MTTPPAPRAPFLVTAALLSLLASCALAHAQGRTDVVTLTNGDRITGEVMRLERGQLEFKTDDAGTLFLEWDNVVSLLSLTRRVEVLTTRGLRFVGHLGPAPSRSVAVVGADGTVTLPMAAVTLITPIGRSFWRRLDGSFDAGFSYTKSSGVAQFNFNSDTVYRWPASSVRLTASATLTEKDDGSGRDDRGTVEASNLRYPWQRWFVIVAGRFETNESLGLELRSQAGGAAGPRLVNSNRAQMVAGAGLAVNDERGVDVESTRNIEALFLFRSSFFTYDRPKTNLDLNLQYYPSLNQGGRHRVQLDAYVRREVWKDLFISLSAYNTFDSRPPNPDANTNDFGTVLSIGWTY